MLVGLMAGTKQQAKNVEDDENARVFKTLFDLMPQLGWAARPDGFIDVYNKSFCEYTGRTPEQLAGWEWESIHDPRYLPEVNKRWRHSIETGTPFEMEFPLRGSDGQFHWFLTRINPVLDDGKIIRWVGINTNVDNEHRANEQIEHMLIERTQDAEQQGKMLSKFVETGNFREASKSILKEALQKTESEFGFVGVTVPGGPQGTILRILADEGFNWSRVENRALYDKIIADYESKGYIEFPRLDNLFGWAILNKKPMIANDPNSDDRKGGRVPAGHPPLKNFIGVPIFKGDSVVGLFGIANRVNGYSEEHVDALQLVAKTISVIYESYRRMEQEHLFEAERVQSEAKLRAANQALIDLAYTVSHELQEPLALIRSQLSLLAARYTDRLGPDADGYIATTKKSAEIVERIIDDLWEYSRIDLPHIKFESLNLGDIFDSVQDGLKHYIERHHAEVVRGDMPAVAGDSRQLTLLIKQLMMNAIKFNTSEIPTVNFSCSPLVDEIEFCISDNGIGFDINDVNEIFKVFRKLSKDHAPGSGMGLAICKKIVEFHGGRIRAESSPGNGSMFYFTIPVVPIR